MGTCPKCGREYSGNQGFCSFDGTPLLEQERGFVSSTLGGPGGFKATEVPEYLARKSEAVMMVALGLGLMFLGAPFFAYVLGSSQTSYFFGNAYSTYQWNYTAGIVVFLGGVVVVAYGWHLWNKITHIMWTRQALREYGAPSTQSEVGLALSRPANATPNSSVESVTAQRTALEQNEARITKEMEYLKQKDSGLSAEVAESKRADLERQLADVKVTLAGLPQLALTRGPLRFTGDISGEPWISTKLGQLNPPTEIHLKLSSDRPVNLILLSENAYQHVGSIGLFAENNLELRLSKISGDEFQFFHRVQSGDFTYVVRKTTSYKVLVDHSFESSFHHVHYAVELSIYTPE